MFEKAKRSHLVIRGFLKEQKQIPRFYNDQLSRSSLSVVLNIAEGSGRMTNNDRKHFYIISRGSVYETVALLGLICEEYQISGQATKELLLGLETISKMISGLIKSMNTWSRTPSPNYKLHTTNYHFGEMPERLNGAVSKTVDLARDPGVRIPLSPRGGFGFECDRSVSVVEVWVWDLQDFLTL